jgi:hypothetical protein
MMCLASAPEEAQRHPRTKRKLHQDEGNNNISGSGGGIGGGGGAGGGGSRNDLNETDDPLVISSCDGLQTDSGGCTKASTLKDDYEVTNDDGEFSRAESNAGKYQGKDPFLFEEWCLDRDDSAGIRNNHPLIGKVAFFPAQHSSGIQVNESQAQ